MRSIRGLQKGSSIRALFKEDKTALSPEVKDFRLRIKRGPLSREVKGNSEEVIIPEEDIDEIKRKNQEAKEKDGIEEN